jgi:Protein of unknown function (DUF4232)
MSNRAWNTVAAAAAMGTLLVVSGCAATSEPEATGSPSATATESPAESPTSASPSPTAADTAPSGPASAAPAPQPQTPEANAPQTTAPGAPAAPEGLCSAGMLSGAVVDVPGGAAAGSVYRSLQVTNTSGASCVLDGYPGVSYVDAAGNQIGAPADRDPSQPRMAITLQPGQTAAAVLKQTNGQNYQDCQSTPAAGVRVYPPSATDWLIAPQDTTACANAGIVLMTIGAFQPL